MHLLFVADPLESFKTHKDSTFAMMQAAVQRGHRISACEPSDMTWHSGGQVVARVRELTLTGMAPHWFRAAGAGDGHKIEALAAFSVVLMRKDPPFDTEYFYATHLLEQAQREGAKVFNHPRALRDHPEKLAIMEFDRFTPPTLVTRNPSDVRRFHAEHRDVILKPLDGMGGAGIFRVGPDGMNLGSVIETLNQAGRQTMMVQRFVPEIADGDKRIVLIDGQPVPYCLARIPQQGEVRGNLAAGGMGVARALSARDAEIAEAIGPKLRDRGLFLVGLDVIGDRLTEINVTSPTCFQEIKEQTGWDVGLHFIRQLERTLGVGQG